MFARRIFRAPLGSRFLEAASRPVANPLGSTRRCLATTSTSSTSTSPDARVAPLSSPTSNPHAARPGATEPQSPPTQLHESKPVETAIGAPAPAATTSTAHSLAPSPPTEQPNTPIPASVLAHLPTLAQQRPHYATVHIHGRPYLVTEGDRVRLPFRMPDVAAGDVLRLTRASTLGSRDYSLRGAPWVDSRLFACRAVVASVEAEPMRLIQKTKRRNRRIKTVRSKHRYTEIVVSELNVTVPAEA